MLNKFRNDPNYLTRYHAYSIIIFFILNTLLIIFKPIPIETILIYIPSIILMSFTRVEIVACAFFYSVGVSILSESFNSINLAGLPAAIIICFPVTGLLHNAAHNLMKPKWLNRPVGEILSLSQLTGFADWKIIHLIHHEYTDIPGKDPHPPMNKTFLQFFLGVRKMVSVAIANYYFERFGKTSKSINNLKRLSHISQADQCLRVLFWFHLLGAQIFSFFFTSAILFKMFQYAWLNYHTHPIKPHEQMKDLNDGIYKYINIIGFGFYCHKSHHRTPRVFDPRSLLLFKASEIRSNNNAS